VAGWRVEEDRLGETAGTPLDAHERRDCLVASDFTCKRLQGSGGGSGVGGAVPAWCYVEVVPDPAEKGRLMHTLTDWSGSQYNTHPDLVNFTFWGGSQHYPTGPSCGQTPAAAWCAAQQRLGSWPNASRSCDPVDALDSRYSYDINIRDQPTNMYYFYTGCDVSDYRGAEFDQSQAGAVLVQLLDPTQCLSSNTGGVKYNSPAVGTSTDDSNRSSNFAAELPLLAWFVLFAGLAVADRVLLMGLFVSENLASQVVGLRSLAGPARYGRYEEKLIAVVSKMPRRYFFVVVVSVVAWVTYSILRVMLQEANVNVANTDYYCEVFGRNGFNSDLYTYGNDCGVSSSNILVIELWLTALLATVPAVQLFTPVLAAILLMKLVIQVHLLEVEAATEQLRAVASSISGLPADRSSAVEDEGGAAPHITGTYGTFEKRIGGERAEWALRPFLQVQQHLAATSEKWSWVLLTEATLLGLLICEPIVAAHTSGTVSAEYLLVSNVMAAVALPFVLLLGVGGAAIVELNEKIAAVPRLLTAERLLTLPERNMFCLEFGRMELGLRVFGVSLTKARIGLTFSTVVLSNLFKALLQAQNDVG
jgi:hypothetical protein